MGEVGWQRKVVDAGWTKVERGWVGTNIADDMMRKRKGQKRLKVSEGKTPANKCVQLEGTRL